MATFDQLSAEQRAIIELVLKQGQSYDQLADMLAMPSTRVRELARDALVRLSPVSADAVDAEWRGQIADYLLNAQSGPEQTATRGHLRRSESARAWGRSVLDSLEQFYADGGIPSIPDGEPGAREPRRARRKREPAPVEPAPVVASPAPEATAPEATAPTPEARRALSPEARSAVRRRRLAGSAGALALVVAVAVLFWPIGLGPLAVGGDEGEDAASSETSGGEAGPDDTQNAGAEPQILAQLPLGPVESLEGSREAAGIAAIALDGEERTLIVQAQLPESEQGQAYQVWLYNADDDAVSLGAQVTDARGVFQGAGPLPDDFEKYRFVDVSREDIRGGDETHSGESVLRGALADLAPPAAAEGGAAAPAPESP